VLVVLSIGSAMMPQQGSDPGLVSVRFRAAPEQPEPERAEDVPEAKAAAEQPSARPVPRPTQQAIEPRPEPTPALIPLSPPEMAASDIAPAPKAPPPPAPGRGMMGPPDTSPAPRDSQRVSGSGPNGEPLYAASWYREPYPDELSGYLQTAAGPGWGLIACRTVPDFRVEDCVAIDEHPNGSNIARAVLAAAWQFRVRPPRVGGQLRVGEWVRIRITYDMRQQ
jgi:periplasmic protein TonB